MVSLPNAISQAGGIDEYMLDRGWTKMALTTFTPSVANNIRSTIVPHGLGEIPKAIIVFTEEDVNNASLKEMDLDVGDATQTYPALTGIIISLTTSTLSSSPWVIYHAYIGSTNVITATTFYVQGSYTQTTGSQGSPAYQIGTTYKVYAFG